jgi:hypothetical protein
MESFYSSHMDITVVKQVSVFDGLVLRENVNEEVLHKLINSDLLLEVCHSISCKSYANEKEQLMLYKKLIKENHAYVLYSKKNFGRCVSDGGLSLLNIRRPIRHNLAQGLMVDLDIENCHPCLMLQMLEKHGFRSVYLRSYVDDRERWFTIIKQFWEIEKHVAKDEVRDCCKRLFLRITYGGGYKKWVFDHGLHDYGRIPADLEGFMEEMREVSELFISLNPELEETIKNRKEADDDEYTNMNGKLSSTVMQEKENTVLEIIYSYLRRRDVGDVMSLCADGIMISKDKYNINLLKELEVEVFIKTGFVIKMTQKEMEQGFKNIDEHVTNHIAFAPNENYKAIDKIVNRVAIMYEDFKISDYFDESMTVVKKKQNSITLKCSSKKCKLCFVKHEPSQCTLKMNDNGNFVFCCHGAKKVYKKSVKGVELMRTVQTEVIDSNIEEFFKLNLTGVNVVRESSLFLGCDEEGEIVMKREYLNKFLFLNAHMGKGKTSFINTMLNFKACAKILFVSQRKTFTNFICSEFNSFGIVNYQDIKNGNYNVDRLCIQVESLHKIDQCAYDVVIIDEVETVLNQYSSSTMDSVRECWKVLLECIKNSSWCVLADAFILNRSLDFVRGIKKDKDQITMLLNERPYLQGRKCIQISQDEFNGNLIADLSKGKRVVSISGSRDDLIVLEHDIKSKCPDKRLKAYDKDSDKSDLKNVNKIWSECDWVGYTPVVQTGVSYMDKPFDLCYANLKKSNLARDAMQMMMRCRKLNDETVYFSLSKRQIFNTSNITMFETFDMFKKDRYERTHMLIDGLRKDKIKNENLISMLQKTLETTDDVLLKVMWHNLREHMLSQCHYNSICIYLLKKQAYDVVLLKDTDHNKDKALVKVDLGEDYYATEYNSIMKVSDDDVRQMKYAEMNKNDRLCVDKHYFEKMTIGELPSSVKGKLFFDHYQSTHRKHHLSNIKYEKSELSEESIVAKDFDKNDMLVNKMSMISKKLSYMRKFNELLGLDHSCHTGEVIDKKLITGKVLDYMSRNIKELAVVYKSKIKLTGEKRNDNFCALKLLQKIYNDWSGLAFKKYSVNNKGDASQYITDCYEFYEYIVPYNTERSMDDVMMHDDDEQLLREALF